MKNTEKTFDESELETPENIRLMISILDAMEYTVNNLKKLDFYVSKYFPSGENTHKETIVRRIV